MHCVFANFSVRLFRLLDMSNLNFPLFKTKIEGVNQKFRLEDPSDRRKYFEAKAGPEIEKIKLFMEKNSFIGILLGKKNSGKGTYSKLFAELVGSEKIAHISVGDIVRAAHDSLKSEDGRKELETYLSHKYRGFIPLDKIFDVIEGRDTKTLLPTELILTLVERQIDKIGKKSIFVDGFPRNLDQISYSLYFRTIIGYRDNLDFFTFIDLPEAVINERMRYRRVCPNCHTPRSLRLGRTKEIGFDSQKGEFYLKCDNPGCNSTRMIKKEGDESGVESIRERLEVDETVMKTLMGLQGVPKIFLRNSFPAGKVATLVDDYEVTPAYYYHLNEKNKEISVEEKPWIIKDDDGTESYSLLPPPVLLSFIKQLASILVA